MMQPSEQGGGVHGVVRYPLRALVLRYVSARERRGTLSNDTAARMRRRLNRFADHAPDDIRKVTRHHIQHHIERPDLASSTLRVVLSDLRGFFRWAVIEGHARRDPTVGIEPPELPERVPGALSIEDSERVLMARRRLEPRVRLILSLEHNEALRRVEVARAQVGDIDRRARTIRVRGKAKGGKGDVTGVVPLSDETMAALDSYLASEPGILGIGSLSSGPLFRNRWRASEGLTAGHVGRIVTDELYRIGVKRAPRDGVGGHSLRHTAATEALEAGVPKEIVQRLLRHEDPSSTEIYTKGAVLNLRQFHERRQEARENDVIDLRREPDQP